MTVTCTTRDRRAPAPPVSRSRDGTWFVWLPVLVLTVAGIGAGAVVEPWLWMWILAGGIYAACKAMTLGQRYRSSRLHFIRTPLYLFLWPGMDAPAFLADAQSVRAPGPGEWLFAFVKTGIGVGLLWWIAPRIATESPTVIAWVGMIGTIFILHFGFFHLLSCAWRAVRIDAVPIMQWPVRSRSLGEFWGRRWNRAFRDIVHPFMFKPLRPRLGKRWATVVTFVASGLVHDLVISVPAGGGYGLPTLYFLIQAIGLQTERSRIARRLGLRRGVRGWLFTVVVVAGPAPLLFHGPFVHQVFLPFMTAIGAR